MLKTGPRIYFSVVGGRVTRVVLGNSISKIALDKVVKGMVICVEFLSGLGG